MCLRSPNRLAKSRGIKLWIYDLIIRMIRWCNIIYRIGREWGNSILLNNITVSGCDWSGLKVGWSKSYKSMEKWQFSCCWFFFSCCLGPHRSCHGVVLFFTFISFSSCQCHHFNYKSSYLQWLLCAWILAFFPINFVFRS